MKARILALLCLPFLLPLFSQCDLVEEDASSAEWVNGEFNHASVVVQNSATVIDLLPRESASGQTTFSVITAPLFGEASIKDNKFLVYAQSENTTSDKDVFNIEACRGGECSTGIIELSIVASPDSLPCSFMAFPDSFTLPSVMPPMQETYFLPVLENDRFCSAMPDSAHLVAVVQPHFGQLFPAAHGFQYVPFSNATAAPYDEFIYQVRSMNGQHISFALVRLTFDSLVVCMALPSAQNDHFVFEPRDPSVDDFSMELPVLANDMICDYAAARIGILETPETGTVQVLDDGFTVEFSLGWDEADQEGQARFVYGIYHNDVLATQAEVLIDLF